MCSLGWQLSWSHSQALILRVTVDLKSWLKVTGLGCEPSTIAARSQQPCCLFVMNTRTGYIITQLEDKWFFAPNMTPTRELQKEGTFGSFNLLPTGRLLVSVTTIWFVWKRARGNSLVQHWNTHLPLSTFSLGSGVTWNGILNRSLNWDNIWFYNTCTAPSSTHNHTHSKTPTET